MGVLVNVTMGFLIARVNVRTLVVTSALVTLIAAPLMATINVGEKYWLAPFWALFLSPVNPDGPYCTLMLFPSQTHVKCNSMTWS